MRANWVDFALDDFGADAEPSAKRHVGIKGVFLTANLQRIAFYGLLVACLIMPKLAYSVGVGAADVRSNLGEPLRISIPIFNVTNPDNLVISVGTDMFGNDPSKRLSASLDRSNGQLAVSVYTSWPVMEPYVQFDLELQDGGVRQAKGFILLLEFRPSTGRADPLRVDNSDVATAAVQQPNISVQPSSAIVTPASSGVSSVPNSVMGPYDWAEEGQVATSFGAVLDGQSLWRVARRINKAMGVSVEQMMVALYDANPDAFYSDSISSLKAGSYLSIPDQSTVQRLSEKEAMQRIDDLSTLDDSAAAAVTQPVVTEPEVSNAVASTEMQVEPIVEDAAELLSEPTVDETPAERESLDQQPMFVIGDRDDVAAAGDGAAESSGADAPGKNESQQIIIDSLSQTIGDLMQDNVDKEQRLQAMDERLRALETTLDNVGLQEASGGASVPATGDEKTAWWLWLLPILAGFGAWLGLRARRDISSPEDELFTPRTEEDIEPYSVHVVGDQPAAQGFDEYYSDTDFSVMRSHRVRNSTEVEDENEVEGVSYHELDDDYMPEEHTKLDEHTIEFDTSNVASFPLEPKRSLQEAVDGFIEKRDFSAAIDVLDAARGKELDEPNYHFQRLRILLEKSDEHGFYEYFNLVEAKFDDVDRDLKMDLANLVSRLNQQH